MKLEASSAERQSSDDEVVTSRASGNEWLTRVWAVRAQCIADQRYFWDYSPVHKICILLTKLLANMPQYLAASDSEAAPLKQNQWYSRIVHALRCRAEARGLGQSTWLEGPLCRWKTCKGKYWSELLLCGMVAIPVRIVMHAQYHGRILQIQLLQWLHVNGQSWHYQNMRCMLQRKCHSVRISPCRLDLVSPPGKFSGTCLTGA